MSRINIGKVAPIPKGDWVQSQPYEKLNMVSKSGVLYIAKQDVPANTAITNTDYWMQTTGEIEIGNVETVSASTGASVTTTTSVNGNTILNFKIPRGESGNETIDDSKGEGDTDYVWSADKTFNEINNIKNEKASAITETASGDIASFTDGADSTYVKNLKVTIEPIQDLHGYDAPWPAGGGKNILDVTKSTDGYRLSITTGNPEANSNFTVTDYISCKELTTYTANWQYYSSGNYGMAYYDSEKVFISGEKQATAGDHSTEPWTFSTPSGANYMRLTYVPANVDVNTLQIELGSSSTSFAPYSNICSISGHDTVVVTRTGKNLYNPNDPDVVLNKYLDSSTTSVNYGKPINANGYWVSGYISVKPGVTYYKSPDVGSIRQCYYNVNKEPLSFVSIRQGVFTPPEDAAYIRFTGVTDTISYDGQVQIELGSSPTAYEAPQIQTVTIDLNGTRYGGTLNVTTGMLTVTKVKVVFDGSDSGKVTYKYPNKYCFNITTDLPQGILVKTPNNNSTIGLISDMLTNLTDNVIYNGNNTGIATSTNGNFSKMGLAFLEPESVTVANAWLAEHPITIIAPLAEPQTVQLSPSQMQTLFGQNNIWADSGNTEVIYRADTKLYIEKLTQPTEDDMIANNNIEANKFFMLGNSLYYSTTAIAAGTSIIPGDNCTKLSLADALNNLNS